MEKEKTIFDIFDSIEEYPKNLAERGVEQNTLYQYVSVCFLKGLVNHIKILRSVMVERYTTFGENTNKMIDHLKSQNIGKMDYSGLAQEFPEVMDDILMIGETESSFWFLWSDTDVSDCCIGRVSKDKVSEFSFKYLFDQYISKKRDRYFSGKFIELPISGGWISL